MRFTKTIEIADEKHRNGREHTVLWLPKICFPVRLRRSTHVSDLVWELESIAWPEQPFSFHNILLQLTMRLQKDFVFMTSCFMCLVHCRVHLEISIVTILPQFIADEYNRLSNRYGPAHHSNTFRNSKVTSKNCRTFAWRFPRIGMNKQIFLSLLSTPFGCRVVWDLKLSKVACGKRLSNEWLPMSTLRSGRLNKLS